ncbi:MAG: alpha/beta fold hydrolase, partial [Calditrichaeota bacterium]
MFLNNKKLKYLIVLCSGFIVGVLALTQFGHIHTIINYHLGIDKLTDLKYIRITRIPKTQDIYFQGNGLRIAATLFRSQLNNPPGIVFLHGSSPLGRKHPFSLLLCQRLSRKGYHVLAMDMRGFGESDDPKDINNPESWQSYGDIRQAINYLIEHTDVDTGKIYIVGHSAGANQAIIAGIKDSRIKKIVAIGPSRRVKERLLSNESKERPYFIQRFTRDRRINATLSWATYKQIAINAMIDSHLSYFQKPDHKPILLIDGGRENLADLEFLRNLARQMKSPKKYVTIPNSNHYANSKGFGPFIFYHKKVFK